MQQSLVRNDDNAEVYSILKSLPNAPKNIIIPKCLSSVLFEESLAELNILDFPDQVPYSPQIFFLSKNLFNFSKI